MLFKQNTKILLQGDSISDAYRSSNFQDLRFFPCGEDLGIGFPKMVEAAVAAKYPNLDVKFYNRAISGNRTCDLVERWQKDCLDICPDILIMLIGINDVWRKFDANDPTSTDQFEKNYRYLLESARSVNPDLKIILLEPSYLNAPGEFTDRFRAELLDKIEVVRRLEKKFNAWYIPMDGILAGLSTRTEMTKWVFDDGVHYTNCGHGVAARELMRILEEND